MPHRSGFLLLQTPEALDPERRPVHPPKAIGDIKLEIAIVVRKADLNVLKNVGASK